MAWATAAKVAVPLLAGLVVFVLLFPASRSTDIPPECYSLFAYYNVPCGSGVAITAGVATAVVVGLALWLTARMRERRDPASG